MKSSILIIIAYSLYASALIPSPPRILKQPPTKLRFKVPEISGDKNALPLVIECEAEGEPAPTYHWTKNGEKFDYQADKDRISQHPNIGTLVISSQKNEDSGQYQCFAENKWGTAVSNSVIIRKIESNQFTDHSDKVLTANEGEPFNLSCEPPGGWPKPNLIWWLSNTISGGIERSINDSRITPDPEGNLWFSNVTRDDKLVGLVYVCAAWLYDEKSYKIGSTFNLNVIQRASNHTYPLTIQYLSKQNEVALRGEKIELFCIYGGTPLPEITWSKNNRTITPSDARAEVGNYGKSLVINSVDFEDEGLYKCEASNSVIEAMSYSINLTVEAVPYFIVEPVSFNKTENDTVTFICEAMGVPQPEIKWIHNGKPLSEALPNSRRYVTKNTLTIEQLTKNDTGNYGCNATNLLGYVYKDVYVNVLAIAPEIIGAVVNETIVDGETSVLTCPVFGMPKPTVTWTRNGQELITDERYKIQDNGDLEIKEANPSSDVGSYVCWAVNQFGGVNATVNLVEEETSSEKPIVLPEENEEDNVSTAGMLIGIIIIVVLLIALALAVIFYVVFKRNREGIYPVQKRQRAAELDTTRAESSVV